MSATIPLATYRLQLNRDFTFADAIQLVPYLHALGISHCYTSPFLKARSESTHGYDVVDHNAINSEIGTIEDFERLVSALRGYGMSLLVDVVPNHMGVLRSDNAWWLDVLENGQASPYADFFDIDWTPLKEELRGKVLLPVLGDYYGSVLDRGEIQLRFDAAEGQFSAHYHEHRFPIDPSTYPLILESALSEGDPPLTAAESAELERLLGNLNALPPRTTRVPITANQRLRQSQELKQALARFAQRSGNVRRRLEQALAALNGNTADVASLEALHELLSVQAYRLAHWRVAAHEINYRRFFDINDLAALRMENEAVFEATHRFVLDCLRHKQIGGLRVDHPDGLYDPLQYVTRLQQRAAEALGLSHTETQASRKAIYLVLEKIIAPFEHLPTEWPVHGTTGYRFANVVNGLFVAVENEKKFDRLYQSFTGESLDFGEVVYRSKRLIMTFSLGGELAVLTRQLSRIAEARRHTRDFTEQSIRDALLDIVACFPVYRTYFSGVLSNDDRRYIEWASARAKKRSWAGDSTIYDFVRDVLTTDIARNQPDLYRTEVTTFAMRFQQYTGPAMAKGFEDTACYRFNRLISLNDVGGDPDHFGMTLNAFHGASADRLKHWPATLLATSTHDSKRSEDVRARINVLSEAPAEWGLALRRWSRINRNKRRLIEDAWAPSRNDEYYFYQTLIGVYPLAPIDEQGLEALRTRVEEHMLKAAREAKVHTSWINPHHAYEEALRAFVHESLGRLDNNLFLTDFTPFAQRIADYGLLNSLSQTLIKLTSPGVPDIYQGAELWNFKLVDPDNRSAVDYAVRQRLLSDIQSEARGGESLAVFARALCDAMTDGRAKLFLIWRALALRRAVSEVFQHGDYIPLAAEGDKREHVCAFARRAGDSMIITVAPRWFVRLTPEPRQAMPLAWGNTTLALPTNVNTAFVDVFTQQRLELETARRGLVRVDEILTSFPVALLVDEGAAESVALTDDARY